MFIVTAVEQFEAASRSNYMRKQLMKILAVLSVVFIAGQSCAGKEKNENMDMRIQKEIYFAGGCFWGTEHFMKQIRGVTETAVGYANSRVENPSYQEVCTGRTGAAETVRVAYDPSVVSLDLLVDLYLQTIDPTSLNRQGNDIGTQYRTGIYYVDEADRPLVEAKLARLDSMLSAPVEVEARRLENFYAAEDYHQDYLDKNPGGYCHLNPSLFALARKANAPRYERKSDEELRATLTKRQYEVTQRNATEPPFANEYYDNFEEGIYVDVTTGEPLFVSTDKFESGCGWPAFSKPIDGKLIVAVEDNSHGMQRTEVRSKTGDAHLGHVFDDGPTDKGGLRYCINSASLRFVPKARMAEEGYADYLPLLAR